MEYKIIRSDRKTLALQITRDGELVVRAPRRTSLAAIEKFISDNGRWIEKHKAQVKARAVRYPEPTEAERERYIAEAKEYLPRRVEYFSTVMGVCPTGITVTGAKTRYGSCSAKNRLSFSWRTMQYPKDFVDYVVVHELAHIKHKNHGREFYSLIASVVPNYKEIIKEIKGD